MNKLSALMCTIFTLMCASFTSAETATLIAPDFSINNSTSYFSSSSSVTWSVISTPDPSLMWLELYNSNGGESYISGDTVTTNWTEPGPGITCKLFLRHGDGSTTLLGRKITGDSYQWTVPEVFASDKRCKLLIRAFDSTGTLVGKGRSDSFIAIEPSPAVLAMVTPNGGDSYTGGETVTVKWSEPVDGDSYRLYLKHGDGSIRLLVRGLRGNRYDWTVPDVTVQDDRCKLLIRAYDNKDTLLGRDFSDDFITIGPAPLVLVTQNGGESYISEDTVTTTWVEPVEGATYKLFLKHGDGSTTLLGRGLTGNSYQWTVPAVTRMDPRNKVLIRAFDANGVLVGSDRSDHFFTINSADGDWQTHQRSPGHQGYVPISVDPTHFAYAWDWSRDPDSEPNGGINPVVTSDGKVYVSTDVYSGQGVLYALNELNGSEAWRVSFGQVPYLNPPAVHNGQVYVAVTGHQNTALWAFEADTGGYIFKSPFSSQWPSYMAPTVFGDQVYTGGGYYGGINYSFSTEDGSPLWSHSADGLWDMYTPAVNDSYVFHYNGDTLFMIDRATGETAAAIFDPFGNSSNDNEYFGAPMLGSNHNVFTFAGGAFSGSGGSSTEQYEQRVFSSFDIDSQTYEWSTSHAYLTAPAVAGGVIYAARNNPMSLDAIDEVSGQVLWSWAPSAAEDSEFHRNIVVTRNILFVSTDKAVYAVDLASKTPVWKYPKPGMLAISANRMLYIATGARKSDGGLVAIDLQSEPEPSIPPS